MVGFSVAWPQVDGALCSDYRFFVTTRCQIGIAQRCMGICEVRIKRNGLLGHLKRHSGVPLAVVALTIMHRHRVH